MSTRDSTSSAADAQTQPTSPQPAPGALQKACQSCRAAKTKCIIKGSPGDTSQRCQRCTALGRVCSFGFVARRKPRRRTDTRVAELEKQLSQLKTAMMVSGASNHTLTESIETSLGEDSTRRASPIDELPVNSRQQPSMHDDRSVPDSICGDIVHDPSDTTIYKDPIDLGLISMELADDLVLRYKEQLFPQWPFIPLHPRTTARQLRSEKPTLFLAVLAAAATGSDPSLFRSLNVRLLQRFAEVVVLRNQKTIELIQSMLIMAVWPFPADKFIDLNYSQYMHLAATMAMDLGWGADSIGTSRSWSQEYGDELACHPHESGWQTMERQRTLLGCYLLSSGIAITSGRPSVLRFTRSMAISLHHFRSVMPKNGSDRNLVFMIDAQLIAEQASRSIHDNMDRGQNDFTIFKTQVSEFSNAFETLEQNLHLDSTRTETAIIEIKYYQSRVLEAALYGQCEASDFQQPYMLRHQSVIINSTLSTLTPGRAWAIFLLVKCVHGIIETFCGIKDEVALTSPITNYTRAFHAMIVLNILHMASLRPGNDLGQLIDGEHLKVKHYFEMLGKALARLAGERHYRVPFKFLQVLRRLYAWWDKACNLDLPVQNSDQYFRPLSNLSSASLPSETRSTPSGFTATTKDTFTTGPEELFSAQAALSTMLDANSYTNNGTQISGAAAAGQYGQEFAPGTSETISSVPFPEFRYPDHTPDAMAVINRLLCLDPTYEDPFVPAAMTDEQATHLLDDLGAQAEASFLAGYDLTPSRMDNQDW